MRRTAKLAATSAAHESPRRALLLIGCTEDVKAMRGGLSRRKRCRFCRTQRSYRRDASATLLRQGRAQRQRTLSRLLSLREAFSGVQAIVSVHGRPILRAPDPSEI